MWQRLYAMPAYSLVLAAFDLSPSIASDIPPASALASTDLLSLIFINSIPVSGCRPLSSLFCMHAMPTSATYSYSVKNSSYVYSFPPARDARSPSRRQSFAAVRPGATSTGPLAVAMEAKLFRVPPAPSRLRCVSEAAMAKRQRLYHSVKWTTTTLLTLGTASF